MGPGKSKHNGGPHSVSSSTVPVTRDNLQVEIEELTKDTGDDGEMDNVELADMSRLVNFTVNLS